MKTVSLDDAQKQLAELVGDLSAEGEILITSNSQPVARLISVTAKPSLKDLQPSSVGGVLRSYPGPDDDLLAEMLGKA